jgi:integrase/recombinase XerD
MPSNLYRRGETYYGRYSVRGELQRVSLRTSDIREARKRLKGIREKAQRQAFGIKDAPIWQQAVIAYSTGVLDANGVKPGTGKRYLVSLRQLDAYFRGKPLPLITVAEVSAYVAIRQEAKATNATIRRDLTAASRVCAFARHKGLMEANPFDAFDRSMLREIRPGITAPTDAAVAAAAAATDAAGEPEMAALIRFLRATGMRAGEALRASWRDLRGTELMIPVTKTSRVRTIDVPVDALPTWGGGGRLFPSLTLDSGLLAGHWRWVRRNLPEGQRFRIHDLRHAYAIAEIRAGRDIYDLSRHLGHSSVKTTEIYLGYKAGGSPSSRKQVTQTLTQAGTNGDTVTAGRGGVSC